MLYLNGQLLFIGVLIAILVLLAAYCFSLNVEVRLDGRRREGLHDSLVLVLGEVELRGRMGRWFDLGKAQVRCFLGGPQGAALKVDRQSSMRLTALQPPIHFATCYIVSVASRGYLCFLLNLSGRLVWCHLIVQIGLIKA